MPREYDTCRSHRCHVDRALVTKWRTFGAVRVM